jgi:aminopeptidase N
MEKLSQSAQSDPFWAVRRSAVETIGNLKTAIDEDLLKKICQDENSKVRAAAFRIIGDKRDPKLLSFLLEQFNSDDSYLAQAEILRAIGKGGDSSQESFLKKAVALKSPRNVLKNAAEWALKELESTSQN